MVLNAPIQSFKFLFQLRAISTLQRGGGLWLFVIRKGESSFSSGSWEVPRPHPEVAGCLGADEREARSPVLWPWTSWSTEPYSSMKELASLLMTLLSPMWLVKVKHLQTIVISAVWYWHWAGPTDPWNRRDSPEAEQRLCGYTSKPYLELHTNLTQKGHIYMYVFICKT